MVRFQVIYQGMPLSVKDSDLNKCETILEVKKLINKLIGLDTHVLVMAYENAMLVDSQRLDQLFDSQLPKTGERAGQQLIYDCPILTCLQARGKCILDVNLIIDHKPQLIELVVPTSIINCYLPDMLASTAAHLKQPRNSVLVASFNRKPLPEGEFIFQSFFDQNRPEVDKSKKPPGSKEKGKSPLLVKFEHADEQLRKYFETNGQYRHFIIDACFKPSHQANAGVGLDFRFNQLRQIVKVSWQEQAPWYREV